MQNIKKAFSLVELIIAIVISSIVLLLIFTLISSSIEDISYSVDESGFFTSYNELSSKLGEYKHLYTSWTVLIDNDYWTWSDILILDNWVWTKWVIFWIVNKQTMKVELNWLYLYYGDKVIWYRGLS